MMTFDKDAGFSIIRNNGRENKYSQKCMLLSILDWFRINTHQECLLKEISLNGLFELVGPFPGSQNDMWDIDKPEHLKYLIRLCELLNIQIHIYYANKENNGSHTHFWLGNPQQLFVRPESNQPFDESRMLSIVAWGMHFDLIVSQTSTTMELHIPPSLEHLIYHYSHKEKVKDTEVSRKRKSTKCTEVIDCSRMNGNRMNGNRMNGNRMNGNRMNGSRMNGSRMDDNRMNGIRMNGSRMNGSRMDDSRKFKKHRMNDTIDRDSDDMSNSQVQRHKVVGVRRMAKLKKDFNKNMKIIRHYVDLIESPEQDEQLRKNYQMIVELLNATAKIQNDIIENKQKNE